MNAIEELLDNYWIIKEDDKEKYYEVKHGLDDKNVKKFLQEMLGWKLIHTERLLKLEKVPAHAQPFMGIQMFSEIHDYCFLCAVLMFLEDKQEDTQFLLSELIRYIETVMQEYMKVDWTSFAQRKSLVRVLQYVEKIGILRVFEGDTNTYLSEQDSEVLYYNTGLSRYFCTNFTMDVSSIDSWRDFEKNQFDELEDDKGTIRTNRVFRQLVVSPNLYWKEDSSADAYYLKNKKNFIASNIEKNIGGTMIVNKHNACVIFEDKTPIGNYHPKTNMLSEIVLLVCHKVIEMSKDARKAKVDDEDTIRMTQSKFQDILYTLKKQYQSLWSKEYRDMANEKYVFLVKQYMKNWMMMKEDGDDVILYPIITLTSGAYSKELEEKLNA